MGTRTSMPVRLFSRAPRMTISPLLTPCVCAPAVAAASVFSPARRRTLARVGGWTRNVVKAGDEVTVDFSPHRDPNQLGGALKNPLAIAAGASPVEAAIVSNHAAGIVVGKVGTATTSPEELLASFGNR